jgi:hypothetical protein
MTEKTYDEERPSTDGRRNNGGKRAGAGCHATTPEPASVRLPAQARQELRILLLNQRSLRNNYQLSQAQLLAEFIHARWLEYDATIQQMAEGATDGLD